MSEKTRKDSPRVQVPLRKLSAKELRGLPSITTAQFEQLVEVVRTLLTFLGVISDA